jgi:hypothetical protein
VRRAGALALAVIVAAAGVFGLIRFFQGRDSATFSSVEGPGKLEPDKGKDHRAPSNTVTVPPPTSGPHAPTAVARDGVALDDDQVLHALEVGDVILAYSSPSLTDPLRALADDVAGPFDPDLSAAGQAVILDRVRGRSIEGVQALAWRHRLSAPSVNGGDLREFIEFWLGRGAG